MKNTSCSLLLFAICLVWLPSANAWEPDPGDAAQVKAAAEVAKYLDNERVREFIEQGYGYAILPQFFRFAVGLGVNYGSGLVVEQDELVGRVSTWQGTIGVTYGLEYHSQIIIFRDRAVMEAFQQGRFEFQGRANAVFLAWGGAANPGFLPDVAIFSRTKAGLMVELAAIVSKYNYKPLVAE
jgi:lipid-binding SYLF domain-containing protein